METLNKQSPNLGNKRFFRTLPGGIVLSAIFLLSAYAGFRYGSAEMDTYRFFSALFRVPGYETDTVILYAVRLPRILGAALAGIGLALSGLLLQSITDNALASPSLIGVNAGAGFMQVLFLRFFPGAFLFLPFASFGGALLATLLILLLAERTGSSKSSLILSGVALGAILNAGISSVTLLDEDVLNVYNAFSVGGLAGIRSESLVIPAAIILLSLIFCLLSADRLNLLCLGEVSATALGVRVKRMRLLAVIFASASAAAAVSFAGLLGFVGLMVPHIARKLVGNHMRSLTISSVLIGGTVVILADLLGRVILAPSEIPVGIMMAFVGAPFLLFLLFHYKKEH